MGKAKKRRSGAGKRSHPIGLGDEDADELNGLSSPQQPDESTVVTNITEQLQATNPEDRVCGLQSLGNLTASPGVRQLVLEGRLVRIAGPLLLDEDAMVRQAAAGALRNLSGLDPDTAEEMVRQDIMTTLTGYFQKYRRSGTDEKQQSSEACVLVECLNLLWHLVEASPAALATFNQEGLLHILLPLISQDTEPALVLGSLNALAAASDSNPAAAEGVRECLPQLEGILVSSPALTTRLTAGLVMCNVLGESIVTSPSFPVLASTLAQGLGQNSRQLVCQLSSSAPVTEEQEMEVEEGGASDGWTADKSFRECEDSLRAQQIALEILTNLCTTEDEEEAWQDNPSDQEDDGDDDNDAEEAAGDGGAVSPVVLEAVLSHNLVSLVLERANSLPENVVQVLNSTAKGRSIVKSYDELQNRAFLCFSNLAGCLSVDDVGGAASLHQTWTSLGTLCLQAQDTKSASLLESSSSCLRAVTSKLVSDPAGSKLIDLTPADVDAFVQVAQQSEVVNIRVNFVHILGDLAVLAAKQDASRAAVLGLLATWLLEVAARDTDLRVVAEALDKTFDAFSEDDTDEVFAKHQLLPKLRQIAHGLKIKLSQQKRSLGPEGYAIVSMASLNLKRFIKYKEKRPAIKK